MTKEEFFLQIKACLAGKGIGVAIDIGTGSISFRGPEAQSERARVEMEGCARAIDPSRLEPARSPTPAQYHAWYAFVVEEAACLREAGYPVGAAPPEQVFVDSGGAWDPLTALFGAGGQIPEPVRRACEHVPSRPGFFDW